MSESQAKKFMFDTEFSESTPEFSGASQAFSDIHGNKGLQTLTDDELEQVRQEAFAEGLASVQAQVLQQTAAAANEIVAQTGSILQSLGVETTRFRAEAVELALMIANKLAHALIEREPEAEIRALIGSCLEQLRDEPHVVVRVAESMADGIRPQILDLAKERGFEGKVIVIADTETANVDCRIEWADGGAELQHNALAANVEAIIARYLEANDAVQGDLFESWNTAETEVA